jgi:hypothetical protein|eukprot:COSAG01_NODE_4077_length_5379_cov_16.101894_8_plen_82_part_00
MSASVRAGHGRTRSQLHFDKENIVNCLLRGGEKRWTMINTREHGAGAAGLCPPHFSPTASLSLLVSPTFCFDWNFPAQRLF